MEKFKKGSVVMESGPSPRRNEVLYEKMNKASR